jgi:hypothetical protein
MTRPELIAALEAGVPPSREIDFWCWWYGASTEAGKPDPRPPPEDYVRDKVGYPWTFRPTTSLDDAMRLVPDGHDWTIKPGLAWVRRMVGDDVVSYQGRAPLGRETALAVTIAVLKAREGMTEDDIRNGEP